MLGTCLLEGRYSGRNTFAHQHTPTHSQTYEQKLTVVTGGIKALYIRKLANSFVQHCQDQEQGRFFFPLLLIGGCNQVLSHTHAHVGLDKHAHTHTQGGKGLKVRQVDIRAKH